MQLDPQTLLDFLSFLGNIDVLLLILVRVIGFMTITPIIGASNIPVLSRVALAVTMAYLVYFSIPMPSEIATYDDSVLGYGFLMIEEFIVGFMMGYVVYIYFNLAHFTGMLIDQQIGMTMSQIMDPLSENQVAVSGSLVFYLICFLLIETGGLNAIITAALRSFQIVPIGAAELLDRSQVVYYVAMTVVDFFYYGMLISMPILGSILIINISLGILVKATPQMNVFVVGMPIKLLAGLIIFYLTANVFASAYNVLFEQAYKALLEVIGGLGR